MELRSRRELSPRANTAAAARTRSRSPVSNSKEIPAEFECALCLRLFYEPISLACGHTYCRECLKAALKAKLSCPICRAPLFAGVADSNPNLSLVSFIQRGFSAEYTERGKEVQLDLAAEAAVLKKRAILGEDVRQDGSALMPVFVERTMVCFPGQPISLFLFERQYLVMITRALSGSRRFVMMQQVAVGSVGAVISIDDCRVLSGGQYMVQVRSQCLYFMSPCSAQNCVYS